MSRPLSRSGRSVTGSPSDRAEPHRHHQRAMRPATSPSAAPSASSRVVAGDPGVAPDIYARAWSPRAHDRRHRQRQRRPAPSQQPAGLQSPSRSQQRAPHETHSNVSQTTPGPTDPSTPRRHPSKASSRDSRDPADLQRSDDLLSSSDQDDPASRVVNDHPSSPSPSAYSPAHLSPWVSTANQVSSPRAHRPKNKRAPASCSSHGIETATGPPPALSFKRSCSSEAVQYALHTPEPTQRTSSQERTATAIRSVEAEETGDNHAYYMDGTRLSRAWSHSRSSGGQGSRDINYSRPIEATADDLGRYYGDYGEDLLEDDRDRTLRALEGSQSTQGKAEYHRQPARAGNDTHLEGTHPDMADHPSGSGDDLFLNLAKSASTTTRPGSDEASRRSERRRSRIALASHRTSLPPASFSSSTVSSSATPKSSSARQLPVPDRVAMPSRVEPPEHEWQQMRSAPTQTSRHRSPTSSSLPVRRNTGTGMVSARPLDEPDAGDRSRFLESAPRGSASAPRDSVKPLAASRPNRHSSHRQSMPDASSINPYRSHQYRQSNLSYTFPQDPEQDQSPLLDRVAVPVEQNGGSTTPRVDGTESTVSTTAPSTVWDELDDLKSRIRKLELTGKLPSSSGAAMSSASGERPRTATTTVTTMSSSPKRGRLNSLSPTDSAPNGQAAAGAGGLHPLLYTSLAKAKTLLEPDVYRALETTASDAMSLATLVGGNGSASSGAASAAGSGMMPDRQLRRKADSTCRSLTELAIALCDARADPSGAPTRRTSMASPRRRGSMAAFATPEAITNNSHYSYHQQSPAPVDTNSTTPTVARSSSRALSRAEARRSSLLAFSQTTPDHNATSNTTPTPNTPSTYTPLASSSSSDRRLSRTSTVLFRNRADLSSSSHHSPRTNDDEQSEGGYRAPSRAATDIMPNTSRYATNGTPSSPREYSTNPSSTNVARSPSAASTSLPLRRYSSHRHQPSTADHNNNPPPVPAIPGNLSSLSMARRYLEGRSPHTHTQTTHTPPAAGGGSAAYEGTSTPGSAALPKLQDTVTRRIRLREQQQQQQQQQQQPQQQAQQQPVQIYEREG